jgi:hypothetical protein
MKVPEGVEEPSDRVILRRTLRLKETTVAQLLIGSNLELCAQSRRKEKTPAGSRYPTFLIETTIYRFSHYIVITS